MRKSIVILAMLVVILLTPQVHAQSSQGLTWGVSEYQNIKYRITKTSVYTPPYDSALFLHESYDAIASFSSFPEIRENLTDWRDIPYSYGMLTYLNGSDAYGAILVLPIGNWDIIQELDNQSWIHTPRDDYFKNATYFDDESEWGRTYYYDTSRYYEYEANVSVSCIVTTTEIFSKVDGAYTLRQDIFDYYWGDSDLGTVIKTTERVGVVLAIPSGVFNLLVIGTIGIGVMIVIVYWLWNSESQSRFAK